MSILKTLNYLYSNFFMEFVMDPSLVLYSSCYAPLLSVLSFLIHQQTTTSVLMILNFCYSELWISFTTSLTLKTLWLTYPTECLPIFCILILFKLSFSFLVYHNNSLNSVILQFIDLTMSYSHLLILYVILVSSLINICHLDNISLLFLNHASTIFVNLLIKLYCLYHFSHSF